MPIGRYDGPDASMVSKDREIVELLDDVNSTLEKPRYFVEEHDFDVPYIAYRYHSY